MDDDYLEAVLDVVVTIPPGRVMTYGTVADVVGDRLVAAGGEPRGGPRQVGQVMSRAGAGAPWWRVVDASGRPPAAHRVAALRLLREDGAPLTTDGERVALRTAIWWPDDHAEPPAPGLGHTPGARGGPGRP